MCVIYECVELSSLKMEDKNFWRLHHNGMMSNTDILPGSISLSSKLSCRWIHRPPFFSESICQTDLKNQTLFVNKISVDTRFLRTLAEWFHVAKQIKLNSFYNILITWFQYLLRIWWLFHTLSLSCSAHKESCEVWRSHAFSFLLPCMNGMVCMWNYLSMF